MLFSCLHCLCFIFMYNIRERFVIIHDCGKKKQKSSPHKKDVKQIEENNKIVLHYQTYMYVYYIEMLIHVFPLM